MTCKHCPNEIVLDETGTWRHTKQIGSVPYSFVACIHPITFAEPREET